MKFVQRRAKIYPMERRGKDLSYRKEGKMTHDISMYIVGQVVEPEPPYIDRSDA